MSADEGKVLYLAWLAREQPLVYARVVAVAKKALLDRKLSGLAGLSGWVDTLVNAAVAVGGTLLAKKQADQAANLQKKQQQADLQLQLLAVNTQRAQSGLPPVDINGNVIPQKSLPLPSTLNTSAVRATLDSGTNLTPWLIGGGLATVALVMVTRGR